MYVVDKGAWIVLNLDFFRSLRVFNGSVPSPLERNALNLYFFFVVYAFSMVPYLLL